MGKSLREHFEEEYAAVSRPRPDGTGDRIEYVYSAPWHVWRLPDKELKRRKCLLLLLLIVQCVFFFLSALVYRAVNTFPAVAICGIVESALLVLTAFACIRFICIKRQATRLAFGYVDKIMSYVPMAQCLCCLGAAVAAVAYMRKTGESDAYMVAAGYFAASIAAGCAAVLYNKIPTGTEKNTTVV